MKNGTDTTHDSTGPEPRFMTLAEEYKRFEPVMVPPDAPSFQRRDIRRAFYAGAAVMFAQMVAISGTLPEHEAGQLLAGFKTELDRFRARVALENALHLSLRIDKGEAQ